MSEHDADQDEMQRLDQLSDEQVDRLLAGGVPSGQDDLADVAGVLREIRERMAQAPPQATAERHVAAMLAETRRTSAVAAPERVRLRLRLRARWPRLARRLAIAVTAATLGTAGLALAGVELPEPAGDVLRELGIEAGPIERSGAEPSRGERAPDAGSGEGAAGGRGPGSTPARPGGDARSRAGPPAMAPDEGRAPRPSAPPAGTPRRGTPPERAGPPAWAPGRERSESAPPDGGGSDRERPESAPPDGAGPPAWAPDAGRPESTTPPEGEAPDGGGPPAWAPEDGSSRPGAAPEDGGGLPAWAPEDGSGRPAPAPRESGTPYDGSVPGAGVPPSDEPEGHGL